MKVRLGVSEEIAVELDLPQRMSGEEFLQLADELRQLTVGHRILKSHASEQEKHAHQHVAKRIDEYHEQFLEDMKRHDLSVEDRLDRIEKQTGLIVALLELLSEDDA